MLRVHSIETFGTHEGPGIRFVLFLQGCQIKCLYCHNPDTQSLQGGQLMTYEEIFDKIIKVKPYFGKRGGFTVSGGEPLLQAKELIPLFIELKKADIHTVIDTNGFILNQSTKDLLELTDLVLLDMKHPDSKGSKIITGGFGNESVFEFIDYIEKINKNWWLRYVFVPGYTGTQENIIKLGEISKNFHYLEKIEILPYHTLGVYKYENLGFDYKLHNVNPPTKDSLDMAVSTLSRYVDISKIFIR